MSLDEILSDVQQGLSVATALLPNQGQASTDVAIASAITRVISGGLKAYEAHTGQPYDLTQLPKEEQI